METKDPVEEYIMQNYDKDLIKAIQNIDLEIALFFVDFCKSHDLLCYMCGGGCIGAVRHHGFIPWDDDLDFFLPRKDYEKLKQLWKDTEKYALRFPTKEDNDHNIFITLRDKTTTMIKYYQVNYDIPHGIAIDIFPLDGCPSGRLARKKQLFWALIYQLYGAQMVPKNHGKLVEGTGKALLKVVQSSSARYKIWKHAEKKMSKHSIEDSSFITELCAGPRYMHLEYPKELFEEALLADFEDTKLPIPIGYDGYLKMAFGNYMELPPEEMRIPSHEAFIDVTRPYTEYKGVKYCIDKSQN